MSTKEHRWCDPKVSADAESLPKYLQCAKFWMHILNNLAQRAEDDLNRDVNCDELPGFEPRTLRV